MPAGSLPGERRGGRQKGTKNKSTLAISEEGKNISALAREHGPRAMLVLSELLNSEEEDVRLKASQALLDRGYGRPAQTTILAGDKDNPLEMHGKLEVSIEPVKVVK